MTDLALASLPGLEETPEEERARLFQKTIGYLEDNLDSKEKALTKAIENRNAAEAMIRNEYRKAELSGTILPARDADSGDDDQQPDD